MFTMERLRFDQSDWNRTLASFPDATPFQTSEWIEFLARTQHGEPVLAAILDGGEVVGYFTGMLISKFGVRILGSPFAGWTTAYMGFNLRPQVPRSLALEALAEFAFHQLHCLHLEFMDRNESVEDFERSGFDWRMFTGFQIDLTQTAEQMLRNMDHQCRGNIRKAQRSGVVIEEVDDPDFVREYYDHMKLVFGRQGLVPTYPETRVLELIRCLLPSGKAILLRAVEPGGKHIASAISVGYGRMAYLWGAASDRDYQLLRPNELMYWTTALKWKERGMAVLDMGGKGEYKRKYGGEPITVPWARKSANAVIPRLRSTAQHLLRAQQWARGHLDVALGRSKPEKTAA